MCASVLWEHCLGPEKEALVHLSSGLRGRRETNMFEGGGLGVRVRVRCFFCHESSIISLKVLIFGICCQI